jgi:hypothetical protein
MQIVVQPIEFHVISVALRFIAKNPVGHRIMCLSAFHVMHYENVLLTACLIKYGCDFYVNLSAA